MQRTSDPFYGKRCVLRPIRDEDLPHLNEMLRESDFATAAYLYVRSPDRTAETHIRELFIHSEASRLTLGIRTHDDVFAGFHDVELVDYERHRVCAPGLFLRRGYRDQGYGIDARILMADFMFRELNAHRLVGATWAENARSLRQYKKIGAVACGRLRDAVFFNGAHRDLIPWSLSSEQFYAAAGNYLTELRGSE